MESNNQALEEDTDTQDGEEELDLEAPLQLLTSVSARLLKGDIPTSPQRLQSLFEHIESVVGEVVDASFEKITLSLDHLEEANEALRQHGEVSAEETAFLREFELGREHIEEGLAIMQETFFSARNFHDLKELEEEFREAEVQLAEGLGRLETAVTRAQSPELFGLHKEVASDCLDEALEAFASSLDALNSHLEDGKPDHLEFVLQQIDIARAAVEKALQQSQSGEPEELAQATSQE